MHRSLKIGFVTYIIFAVLFILFLWSGIIGASLAPFFRFSPSGYLDIALLMLLPPVLMILGAYLCANLVPVFTKLLKGITKRKNTHFFHISTNNKKPAKTYLGMSIYPVLLSLSLSMQIVPYENLYSWLISDDYIYGTQNFSNIGVQIILFLVLLAFCSWIFMIFFAMNASGILMMKRQSGSSDTYLENFGDHLLAYLKGFVGISTAFSFIELYSNAIAYFGFGSPQAILLLIVPLVFPPLLIFAVAPCIEMCENWVNKSKLVLKYTEKFQDHTEEFEKFHNSISNSR